MLNHSFLSPQRFLVNIKQVCIIPHVNSLLVSMEGSVSEAFAVVLPKELAVAHSDVVDLISRAASVHLLPLLRRLLALSVLKQRKYNQIYNLSKT